MRKDKEYLSYSIIHAKIKLQAVMVISPSFYKLEQRTPVSYFDVNIASQSQLNNKM